MEMILAEEDSDIIRRLLDWLNRQRHSLSVNFLEELADFGLIQPKGIEHLLDSTNSEERAAGIVALWNSWDIADRSRAFEMVTVLLKGTPEERIAGIRAIRHSKQERHAHFLEPYLRDPSLDVRREALGAVHRLVNRESSRLLPALLSAIEWGKDEERLVAMDALIEIGDPECITPSSPSPSGSRRSSAAAPRRSS